MDTVVRDLLKVLCKVLCDQGLADDTRPSERQAIARALNILPQHVTKELIRAQADI